VGQTLTTTAGQTLVSLGQMKLEIQSNPSQEQMGRDRRDYYMNSFGAGRMEQEIATVE